MSLRARVTTLLGPYLDRRVAVLVALGFSSGLPAPLVFSNLSIWLRDVGVSRTEIGLFALAATPYAINFLWAPLVDRLRLPYLSARFGRRRGWMLATQVWLLAALLVLAATDPAAELAAMAAAVLFVTFASATQDIVIDAFRVDSLEPERQGAGAAAAIWGWHLGGTLVGGAGGLVLAARLGWSEAYAVLAFAVLVGMLAVLAADEPARAPDPELLEAERRAADRWRAMRGLGPAVTGALVSLYVGVIAPFAAFMRRRGWWLVLLFIFVFKLGDALLGRMSGVFYRELGFDLEEIAAVAKVYGLAATAVGVLLGGVAVAKLGFLRALLVAGLLAAATNLTYAWLAFSGADPVVFRVAVVADNFTAGLATVAFVAYLSSLCDVLYSATQYALLASLGNLARIWLSAGSGWMVDRLDGDWAAFFVWTTVIALAALPLVLVVARRRAGEPVPASS